MKFPNIHQLDATDCGPTCLRIIVAYYRVTISAEHSRKLCYNNRTGTSLLSLSQAAEQLGFHTICAKITWKQLCDEFILPCVVHINQNHFVVVYKIAKHFGRRVIFVSDPASGLVKYSEDQFLGLWIRNGKSSDKSDSGIALMLEPTPALYDNHTGFRGRNMSVIKQMIQYLRPYNQSICQIFLAMITACLLNVIMPFITQSVVDRGILLGRLGFVKTMLIAQLFIVIGHLANDLIRSWLMLHVTVRVSVSLISAFLSKLMRMPIAFFDTKLPGDIMQRIQDHNRIQDFLTNSLFSTLIAVVLFVIYGVILGGYNYQILLVFMLGTVMYIGWVILFLRWRRKIDYMRFNETANSQNNIVQLIGGMQEIKLNNCERQKRWEWERIQAKLYRISIKGLTISQTQQIGGAFIDQTKSIVVSFMAAKSVIDGDITLGMMTSLTYILGQLNAPVSQFISFVRGCQDAQISMERLSEINEREDEEQTDEQKKRNIPTNANIEIRNVSFQYEGPQSTKVLNNISMVVPNGKVTAIVGASGSGKSTLMKILLGIYTPTEGHVTLGGLDISQYCNSSWRRKCGCVMQEGYLFSNSIAENIALSDVVPDFERVRQAADTANIREWIEALPLGYNTIIGSNGQDISIGQKQRILIARAAYKNSPYLFFDEATNSLDANNEKEIMGKLDILFKDKTVVIIAHRLSTVINADNIIVMNHGEIVEEGSHSELCASKGYYYNLVRNQLELGD